MSAAVIPFPRKRTDLHGTVHVMGNRTDGFEVGHESCSGDSWGNFSRYPTAQAAITAAYALNRDAYGGHCDVFVCVAARNDPGVLR